MIVPQTATAEEVRTWNSGPHDAAFTLVAGGEALAGGATRVALLGDPAREEADA